MKYKVGDTVYFLINAPEVDLENLNNTPKIYKGTIKEYESEQDLYLFINQNSILNGVSVPEPLIYKDLESLENDYKTKVFMEIKDKCKTLENYKLNLIHHFEQDIVEDWDND